MLASDAITEVLNGFVMFVKVGEVGLVFGSLHEDLKLLFFLVEADVAVRARTCAGIQHGKCLPHAFCSTILGPLLEACIASVTSGPLCVGSTLIAGGGGRREAVALPSSSFAVPHSSPRIHVPESEQHARK